MTESVNIGTVMDSISRCSADLEKWSKNNFGSVRLHMQKVRRQLDWLQHADPRGLSIEEHKQLRSRLNIWLESKEIM